MPTASETKASETAPTGAPRRWLRLRVGAIVVCALLIFDWSRAPARQWSAQVLLWGIHTYQATLSPWMPSMGVHCRFTPTCSHYGAGAIRHHGALGGSWRIAWRILRCGPWTAKGTHDPVVVPPGLDSDDASQGHQEAPPRTQAVYRSDSHREHPCPFT